jgi:hypothetical protein
MAEECILEVIGAVKHRWQEVKIHVMKLEMRAVVVFKLTARSLMKRMG